MTLGIEMNLGHLGCIAFAAVAACAADNSQVRVNITPRSAPVRNTVAAAALRVDVNMVLIPVTVTDPFGAPFRGLPRDTFRLFEDGVEQEVSYFAAEDAPVSAGVIFDASLSMEDKLDQSREAVERLLRASAPDDEFFLVSFSDTPELLSGFTPVTADISRSLDTIRPKNWTALLDAVYFGLNRMKTARNPRRALIVVSDGADNASRYSESEMRSLVRESDVCIYSIAFSSGLLNRHVRLLRSLAEHTGGKLYEIDRITDLPDAVAALSEAIRYQYLLGYSPPASGEGKYRKVKVKLNTHPDGPRLRASWRTGYYGAQ